MLKVKFVSFEEFELMLGDQKMTSIIIWPYYDSYQDDDVLALKEIIKGPNKDFRFLNIFYTNGNLQFEQDRFDGDYIVLPIDTPGLKECLQKLLDICQS